MVEKNLSQEFRLKNVDETKNYFLQESKMNWWVKLTNGFIQYKLYWPTFYFNFYNYWMYFSFCFVSWIGIPKGIASSAIGLKICVIV